MSKNVTTLTTEVSGPSDVLAELEELAVLYRGAQTALDEARSELYHSIREANRVHGVYQSHIGEVTGLTKARVNGVIRELDAADAARAEGGEA